MIDDNQDMTPGDVKLALQCSLQHATKLMKTEMGAIDIGTGKVPRWRVSRENFDEWHARKELGAKTACGNGLGRSNGGPRSPAKGFLRAAKTARPRDSSAPDSSERPQIRVTGPRVVRLSQT